MRHERDVEIANVTQFKVLFRHLPEVTEKTAWYKTSALTLMMSWRFIPSNTKAPATILGYFSPTHVTQTNFLEIYFNTAWADVRQVSKSFKICHQWIFCISCMNLFQMLGLLSAPRFPIQITCQCRSTQMKQTCFLLSRCLTGRLWCSW
jgi:hypothetical protein